METLRIENIARYAPRARTHLTPLPDFAALLLDNLRRRVKPLSTAPSEEGLVLLAYGDATYEKEWAALLTQVAGTPTKETGLSAFSYGWGRAHGPLRPDPHDGCH